MGNLFSNLKTKPIDNERNQSQPGPSNKVINTAARDNILSNVNQQHIIQNIRIQIINYIFGSSPQAAGASPSSSSTRLAIEETGDGQNQTKRKETMHAERCRMFRWLLLFLGVFFLAYLFWHLCLSDVRNGPAVPVSSTQCPPTSPNSNPIIFNQDNTEQNKAESCSSSNKEHKRSREESFIPKFDVGELVLVVLIIVIVLVGSTFAFVGSYLFIRMSILWCDPNKHTDFNQNVHRFRCDPINKKQIAQLLKNLYNKKPFIRPFRSSKEIAIADVYVKPELVKFNRTGDRHSEIQWNDILSHQDVTRCLLIGDAGFGKTTFMKKMIQIWANKNERKEDEKGIISQFEFLLTFTLGDLDASKRLEDQIIKECANKFKCTETETRKILSENMDKVLLFLDAYDQCTEEQMRELLEMLEAQLFVQCSIVILSRPVAREPLRKLCTTLIKVKGIPLEKKETFLLNCLRGENEFPKAIMNNERFKELTNESYLSPLILCEICHAIKKTKGDVNEFPTEYDKGFIIDQLVERCRSLGEASEEVIRCDFQRLGELYKSLKENNPNSEAITFSQEDLNGVFNHANLGKKCGLLKQTNKHFWDELKTTLELTSRALLEHLSAVVLPNPVRIFET